MEIRPVKAMVIDRFGGPLHMADVPRTAPNSQEVVIGVACAGVNPVDWKVCDGALKDMFLHRFPLIPGWDVAGTVVAMGSAVTGFELGDPVFAYARKPVVQHGAFAEFITLDAEVVAPMPNALGFREAAVVPLSGLTAWQSLFDTAHLKARQSVLVHAGAGGVGGFAIQFAKKFGARVYATASAANADYVTALGADKVIDYHSEDFVDVVRATEPGGIDVVLDTIGGQCQTDSYNVLKPGGKLVSIAQKPDADEAARYDVTAAYVFVLPNGQQLRTVAALIDFSAVRVPQIVEMPLAEAAEALALSRAGHVRGKIVLRVKEG